MHTYLINRNYKYDKDGHESTGPIFQHGEFHWHYDATYQRRGCGSFS